MSESLKEYWGSRRVSRPSPTPSPRPALPEEESSKKSAPEAPDGHDPERARERAEQTPREFSGARLTNGIGVMLILLFVVWLPFTRSPDYFAQLPTLLISAAALGMLAVRTRRVSTVPLAVWLPLAGMVAAALASAFRSDRPVYALFGDGNGLPVVALAGSLALIPFLHALQPNKDRLKTALLFAGALLLGFDLAASWWDVAWFPSPIAGEAMGVVLLALLPLIWRGALLGSEKRAIGRVIGTLVVFAGLLRIGRQDYLAIFALELAILTIFAFAASARRANILRFGVALIALAVLFAFRSFPRIAELSLTHRTTWDLTVQAVRAHPLFGFGPSSFDEVYTRFRPLAQTSESFWTIVPREGSSFVLTMLATYGTAFTILLYGFLFFVLWKSVRRRGRPIDLTLSIGVLTAVSVMTSFSRTAFLLLCILLALSLREQEGLPAARVRSRLSLVLASLGIVGALYGGIMMSRYAVADALFVQAYAKIREASRPETVRGDLQRVLAWYTWDADYHLTAAQHAAVMISLDASKSTELTQGAIEDIHQAMAVNPNSKTMNDALLVLRDLQAVGGKSLAGETETILGELVQRDERNPLTHLFIGEQNLQKAARAEESEEARSQAVAKAKEAFARVEELSPGAAAAKLGNIQIALIEKRYDEAETTVNALIAAFPNEPQFSLLLARVYEGRAGAAQTEEERNSFREKEKAVLASVLERDPTNAEAQDRLTTLGQ